MCSGAPSVVKRRSRYARRLSSVDSTPIESKRFLIVPSLSSAARMPLPGATRARAICSSSVMAALSICTPVLRRLALAGAEQHAQAAELLCRRRDDAAVAHPPRGVDLAPL